MENNSPPGKSRQLFKSAPDADPSGLPLSLSDYIRQHLGDTDETPSATAKTAVQTPQPEKPWIALRESSQESRQTPPGCRLNSLDTESGAGIEHLLPTPAFRLQIVHERLTREITTIQAELNRYQAVRHPSPSLKAKIEASDKKLLQLQYREQEIARELNALSRGKNRLGPVSFYCAQIREKIQNSLQTLAHAVSPIRWIRRLSPKRMQLAEKMKELRDLTDLLAHLQETQRRQRAFSSEEVSDIVHQYDCCRVELDALTARFQKQDSLRERFSRRLWQMFRKLYT